MSKDVENATNFVTVSQLMKEFNLGRNTIINWLKSPSSPEQAVRFYQTGKVIRVDYEDFKRMIEKKIEESMKEAME